MRLWNHPFMGNELNRVGELTSGKVSVSISGGYQWRHIFDFAERRNPKRAFLFVSNVLGRHVPVAPHTVSGAFTSLAECA